MMKRRVILVFSLLATMGTLAFTGSGCSRHDPADSSIPWGRPAAWEDRGPAGLDY